MFSMIKRLKLAALLLVAITAARFLAPPSAMAQEAGPRPPVMQSVFFNVVWGAGTGALLGAASASLAQGQDTDPQDLREQVIVGATVGSLVGAAAGIWLVFNGITFDSDRSLILGGIGPTAQNRFRPATPPLVLETAPGPSLRISGFKALVFDLSF